jgi:hypothetical protein
LGLWGKLSKDLDAWVGLWKYDFWVNLDNQMKKAYFVSLLMACVLQGESPPFVLAREFSKSGEIFQQIKGGVVTIFTSVGHGSGFLIDKSGLILTNNHVINDQSGHLRVKFGQNQVLEARVVEKDRLNDLALLKVNLIKLQEITPLDLFAPESGSVAEVGEKVLAIGSPKYRDELAKNLTEGVVGKVGRDYIYHDAAVETGNSGGPLCNFDGQVIGVNAIRISPTATGGAIPISLAKPLIAKAKANTEIANPSGEFLPDVSQVAYPIHELLRSRPEFFKNRKQASYNFSTSHFDISCVTPPQGYSQSIKLQEAMLASRKKRAKKKGFSVQDDELEYKNLQKYDAAKPVVMFKFVPKAKMTNGSIALNTLSLLGASTATVLTGGIAAPLFALPLHDKREYKKDFQEAYLVDDAGVTVAEALESGRSPLTKFEVEFSDLTYHELIDKTYIGYYAFDPKVFSTSRKLKLVIKTEGDTKQISVAIPDKIVKAIDLDFAPYWPVLKASEVQMLPSSNSALSVESKVISDQNVQN